MRISQRHKLVDFAQRSASIDSKALPRFFVILEGSFENK